MGELAIIELTSAGIARLDLDDIPVAARIVDPETLRFVAANEASCLLYGYSKDEFLRLSIEDLLPPQDVPGVIARLRALSSDGQDQGLWRHRRKDGVHLDVAIIARPIQYEGRSMALVISIDRTEEVQARKLLEQTQHRMVAVTEGVRDALFLLDHSFRFTYVNRNCFAAMHRAPAELIGKELWAELPGMWNDWYRPLFEKVMSDHIPLHFEVTGDAGWFDVDVFPAPDGIGVAYRDITDRKQDDARRSFLLDLSDRIRSMSEPIEVVDSVVGGIGQFLGASRAAYGEFDESGEWVTVERDFARDCVSLVGTHRMSDFGSVTDDLRDGRSVVIRDVHHDLRTSRSLDGYGRLEIRALACVPLIRGGRLVAALAVLSKGPREWDPQDVTLLETVAQRAWHAVEHAKADREMRRLNEELEMRVIERTQELQAAKDDMEGFCYTVSHDLRAPLRAMMASSRILIDEQSEHLDKDAVQQLDRLGRAAKRMGNLIDDLLQFSRLGRTHLNCATVNLSEIVRELSAELVQRNAERRIEFVIQPELFAQGDGQLLHLALQNLLENAVKFSRSREMARIEFGCQDGAYFVRDNGVGFDPTYVDKLFRPFERLHREDEFPGTGIGLANVKRIIDRHGGSVRAEAVEGHGATFWFTLSVA